MVTVEPERSLAHGAFNLRQYGLVLFAGHRRRIGERLVRRQNHAELGDFFAVGGRQLDDSGPQRRAVEQIDPPVAEILAEVMRPQLLGLLYHGPEKLRQDGIGHAAVSVQIGHDTGALGGKNGGRRDRRGRPDRRRFFLLFGNSPQDVAERRSVFPHAGVKRALQGPESLPEDVVRLLLFHREGAGRHQDLKLGDQPQKGSGPPRGTSCRRVQFIPVGVKVMRDYFE